MLRCAVQAGGPEQGQRALQGRPGAREVSRVAQGAAQLGEDRDPHRVGGLVGGGGGQFLQEGEPLIVVAVGLECPLQLEADLDAPHRVALGENLGVEVAQQLDRACVVVALHGVDGEDLAGRRRRPHGRGGRARGGRRGPRSRRRLGGGRRSRGGGSGLPGGGPAVRRHGLGGERARDALPDELVHRHHQLFGQVDDDVQGGCALSGFQQRDVAGGHNIPGQLLLRKPQFAAPCPDALPEVRVLIPHRAAPLAWRWSRGGGADPVPPVPLVLFEITVVAVIGFPCPRSGQGFSRRAPDCIDFSQVSCQGRALRQTRPKVAGND